MKLKKVEIIAAVILGVVIIASVVALFTVFHEYSSGSETYDLLKEYVILPSEADKPAKNGNSGLSDGKESLSGQEPPQDKDTRVYGYVEPQVDFAGLKKQNADTVGWIYGDGTSINYPVVKGSDNDYYLTRMFNGISNKCGSIFLDCMNEGDFSNQNSIVHGHHMKNGTMFADLVKYIDQSYYDRHPYFCLATPDQTYKVEVFAGFVTTADSEVWQLQFETEEDYRSWLDKMVRQSAFKSDVTPTAEDHVLTLATCSYEYDDARFVVMGVLR